MELVVLVMNLTFWMLITMSREKPITVCQNWNRQENIEF